MFIVNNESRFETLRQDLHEAYGHAHDAKAIDAKLDEIIEKHKSKAILDDYIAVLVEREAIEFFGAHRVHVRFAAGLNTDLVTAAIALTKKHAGDALVVDGAVSHPENETESHMAYVLGERGLDARGRHVEDVRTVSMPDYIVYLGADAPRDEAGKDIKIWPIAHAESMEQTRELADDLEARVLYMLNKLGIKPQTEQVKLTA